MPSLEKIVSALAADTEVDGSPAEVDKDFRLLLSSMPTEVFPVSVSSKTFFFSIPCSIFLIQSDIAERSETD